MRKAILLTLLTLIAAALPALADDERHQSYLSYDDGGTVVRTGEDGREVEAHRNLPVYPGDEVITARRGRAEVHLSDGNIIGVDRATAVKFRSILDAYEGERDETVAELRYGKVAVHRTDIGRDHVRLDTSNASYVASYEAVYSVETDQSGRDRVVVFEGSIEVRTPNRSSRLRAGESANVDDRGVYDLVGDQRYAADDFERWFLKRADRFQNYNNRYVDRRLGYWADDLDDHGRWVFVTGIGWSWRPFVSVGWRPYYNGYWAHRHGCLTWVSYDPWGWGPFHYGRWSYDPFHGWFWVPGYGYSPAWVYWWYGPSYVGWAPAGWWDCHRPYYDWAYRPYRNHRDFGFGFYGRIRVGEADLRPWTFIDSGDLISKRVDRAALTADLVKNRLGRSGGTANIYGGAGRFTREDLRDPAGAIKRRGLGGDNSGATGVNTDITGFIGRRDPNVESPIRDRITRGRGSAPAPVAGGGGTGSRTIGGGTISRGTGSGSGNRGTLGGGTLTPPPTTGSGIDRGGRRGDSPGESTTPRDPVRVIGGDRKDNTDRGTDRGTDRESGSNWRDRTGSRDRGGDQPQVLTPPPTVVRAPNDTERARPSDDWRNRGRSSGDDGSAAGSGRGDKGGSGSSSTREGGSSDVPRRVIDRIGGARVVPRDDGGSSAGSSGSSTSRDRGSSSTRDSGSRGDRGSSTRDSGSSRSSGSGRNIDRGSSGSSGSSGGSSRSSGGSGSSSSTRDSGGSRNSGGTKDSGGNRGGGGKIERNQ